MITWLKPIIEPDLEIVVGKLTSKAATVYLSPSSVGVRAFGLPSCHEEITAINSTAHLNDHWIVQAKDNDSTALLLRGLQDGTLKMPKGWDAVPDSPIPLVGDYVDYEDYMREGGGNFEE